MGESIYRATDTVVPPSSLFVFWPGDEPPTAEEVRMRLSSFGIPSSDSDAMAAEGTVWSFWLELAAHPVLYLVWCEQVMGEHLALLDAVRFRSRRQRDEAMDCRWIVGLEGSLSLDQPTADYQLQLELCEAVSGGWAPVVFDASSLAFRTSEDVRHLVSANTPPRSSCLYSIHKVAAPRSGFSEQKYWLHTHGLERAGVPDMELFDVPERLLAPACELIEAATDLWMEFGTPDAQSPFAIGQGLEIAWRPWQAFVAEHSIEAGGWDTRRREPGHSGYRAVLVSPVNDLRGRTRWRSPIEILDRLTRAETTLYKTPSETRRMAMLARERWGSFGTLFASRHPNDWRFAVKLKFPMDEDPRHGEHLWFDCLGIQPGKIRGKLVSEPTFLDKLHIGQTDWFELGRLSDWRIFTPSGVFSPENAETLLED